MLTKFGLEGFYNYDQLQNNRGNLTGELEVAEDGSFEGTVCDHGSMAPEQIIKGHLQKENASEKLLFLKFPPRSNLANLVYDLKKEPTGSFEGNYAGQWGALPYKIEFDREFGIFLASVDMTMCLLGDSTEINLHKK